jgi:tetratricopeptide (TPR) repeat protein
MLTSVKLGELLGQAVCSRAAAMARGRHYDVALELLRSLPPDSDSSGAAALDLQARIVAQRGQFADAERLWSQVKQLNPEHEGARLGLARLARLNVNRSRPLRTLARGIAVACLLACGWWLFNTGNAWLVGMKAEMAMTRLTAHSVQPSAPPNPIPALAALAAEQDEQARRVKQSEEALTAAIVTNQEQTARRLQALEQSIAKQTAPQEALLREVRALRAECRRYARNQPTPGPTTPLSRSRADAQTKKTRQGAR